jgi:PAS domain S-box-containing protein
VDPLRSEVAGRLHDQRIETVASEKPTIDVTAGPKGLGEFRPFRTVVIVIFLCLIAGIAIGGYVFYLDQRKDIKDRQLQALSTIADMKADTIATWLSGRLGNAQVISRNPVVARAALRWFETSAASRGTDLSGWMAALKSQYEYADVLLFDSTGRMRLSTGASAWRPFESENAAVAQAMLERKEVFTDLDYGRHRNIELTIATPLIVPAREEVVGAIVIRIDARRFLFPQIQTWPTPSPTAETLLVRLEKDQVVYLNDLRHQANTALALRVPLTRREITAVQLAQDKDGVVEGKDYRGIEVLAAARRVRGTSWFVIAKVDSAEIYDPIRERAWFLFLMTAFLISAVVTAMGLVWRHRAAMFYRQRYQAELTRRILASHFEHLHKYANDLILLMDARGNITEANDRAVRSYGYPKERLIGMPSRALQDSGSLFDFDEHWNTVEQQGGLIFETVHCRADGSTFPVEVSARIIDFKGKRFRQAIVRDITERRHAEEALRRNEGMLRAILDNVADCVFLKDRESRMLLANPAALRNLGKPPDAVIGKSADEIFDDPKIAKDLMENDRRVIRGGETLIIEEVVPTPSGARIFLSAKSPMRDGKGNIIGLVGVSRDITERKLTEQALRESREDLNRAQAVARTGSWRLDIKRNRLLWSDEAYRLFGIPKGTPLTYETFMAAVHPEDRERVDRKWTAAMLHAEPYDVEHRILAHETVKWVRERAELEYDENGVVQGGFGTVQDVTARKAAEQTLRGALLEAEEGRRIFEAMMEHIPMGIAIADAPGVRIRAVSRYGRELAGRLPERPRRAATDLTDEWQLLRADGIHPATRDELPLTRATLKGEIVREEEWLLSRPDGARVPILCTAAPVRGRDGRITGGVFGWQDISARINIEKELQAAKTAAEAANEAKSRFLASMSHELRTPMNAVLGMTDLALGEQLPPSVRGYLQTARQSGGLLLDVLNEILDFSRIEAGRFELESTPFNIADAVEQVVRTLGLKASEKRLELIWDMPDGQPEWVIGDPLRVRQVLMNLLGNAIKFTAAGEVVLRATAGPPTPESVVWKFSISDTGIGIAPEDRDRIFAPFTQADASTTRQYGGSGLGLAISQRLVNLMGGRIWVESEPGQGSTFHFTVSLAAGKPPGKYPGHRLCDFELFRDLPVLVVAESDTTRHILHRMLSSWSMKVETASDAATALTRIRHEASAGSGYRLVLADAVMQDVSGFKLCEWLQKDARLAQPVILMLSPTDRQNHPDQIRRTKACCLEKPVSRSALLNAICRVLSIAGATALTNPSEPAAAFVGRPLQSLRVLLVEDTQTNQELAAQILGKRGHRIVIVENGRQAVDAVRREDFDVVLMDIQMPLMDGYQATVAIRALDGSRGNVPIVAMTAHAFKADRDRCLAAGMNGYISKPIQVAELIKVVETTAAGCRPAPVEETRELVCPEAPIAGTHEASTGSLDVFNLEEGVKRCLGKYDTFQKMVEYFLRDSGPLVTRIIDAAGCGDALQVYKAAHRLKNSLMYLGTPAAEHTVRLVEQAARSGELKPASELVPRLQEELQLVKQALEPHHKEG